MLWITLHELQALLKISISDTFQGTLIHVQCTIYRITHKRRRVQVPAEKEGTIWINLGVPGNNLNKMQIIKDRLVNTEN